MFSKPDCRLVSRRVLKYVFFFFLRGGGGRGRGALFISLTKSYV